MHSSFDQAFKLTVGLEGKSSWDPKDPGGYTIYGLASRYNPGITPATTLEQAKAIYFKNYWTPAGCDEVPYPMDICLFDSQVNPQNDPKWNYGGNKEIMEQGPENWQEYLLLRMVRYMRNSKAYYLKGHLLRTLKLYQQIRGIV